MSRRSRGSLSQASQPSQSSQHSQGTPRTPAIGQEDLKTLARAVVRYLLMNDFDKVPIKHSDIVKNVTKNVSKNTNQVMQLAAKMLREAYGIKLVDDGGRPNKQYLLVNELKHHEHISFTQDNQSDLALLAIILSFILMVTNGGWKDSGIEQVKVHNFLKLLHIDPQEDHEYFGDVKKKLEQFKSQRYLEVVKILNTDPVKYEYRWGFRACEEVSPREVLQFVSEMYGRECIETWAAQYKAVEAHEKETK